MMQVEGSGSIAVITAFSFSFLQLLFTSSLFLSGISADIDSGVNRWHIITKHNFSYEIRRHPDILLMVTVPWSGDARAISEEVTRLVTQRSEEFGGLRLNLKYKNNGNTMEQVVGTTDEVLYHHKYRSILEAWDILLSARYLLSLPPTEHRAKSMSSLKEVVKFAESSDKDVVFVEGWTFRNVTNRNNGADFYMGLTSLTSAEGRRRQCGKRKGSRMLLQAKKGCPIDMEGLNYKRVTSKCKGPEYNSSVCCRAFKELACPVAEYVNDVTSECATILFSYLNIYGNYPPGLFANQCVEPNKQGLFCGLLPDSSSSPFHRSLFPYVLFSPLLFYFF